MNNKLMVKIINSNDGKRKQYIIDIRLALLTSNGLYNDDELLYYIKHFSDQDYFLDQAIQLRIGKNALTIVPFNQLDHTHLI